MSKIVNISELHPLMAETLQNDGKVILTITGTSMLPLLRHKKTAFDLCNKEIRIENGRLKTKERNGSFAYDTA